MRKKISRNALCPCGSGKKYKHCCWGKDFNWVEKDGGISREIPMPDDIMELLSKQRQKFIDTFGHGPGPNDRIFFDVSEAELEEETVKMLKEVGASEEYIYAYRKTGRLVTEENIEFLTETELKEWDDAIQEFRSLYS